MRFFERFDLILEFAKMFHTLIISVVTYLTGESKSTDLIQNDRNFAYTDRILTTVSDLMSTQLTQILLPGGL
jgi:hypothetical protein